MTSLSPCIPDQIRGNRHSKARKSMECPPLTAPSPHPHPHIQISIPPSPPFPSYGAYPSTHNPLTNHLKPHARTPSNPPAAPTPVSTYDTTSPRKLSASNRPPSLPEKPNTCAHPPVSLPTCEPRVAQRRTQQPAGMRPSHSV